ncbi:MAG: ATP-binding cassette domain-containing protein, partial [Cyclobacteriaceae bacterium]|nr:ATP-binding cassette domain-containing protein [Cyclobacteriaceae bacterium]
SSLLRIVAGTEKHEGKVESGHNVITSFYAQHQLESLGIENEILEELKMAGSGKTDQELRNVLGCFLFSDEEVFKKIKVLSGGEKSRVALARTLISESNFLLLDEPTNHLDMVSVGILEQALQQFEGTFLVVSHDRHFISNVANKIWWIEDQEIKVYPGTYEEFVWWKSQQEANPQQQEVKNARASDTKKTKETPRPRTDNKLEKEIRQLEEEIERKEAELHELTVQMAKPEIVSDAAKLAELSARYQSLKKELDALTFRWEAGVEASGQ